MKKIVNLLIISFLILFVSCSNKEKSREEIMKLERNSLKKSVRKEEKEILSFINEFKQLPKKVENNLIIYEKPFVDLEIESKFIKDIYYGNSLEEFYSIPEVQVPEDFKPSKRPWFKEGLTRKKLSYLTMYRDNETKDNILVYGISLNIGGYDEVLIIDLWLDKLISTLFNERLSNENRKIIFELDTKEVVYDSIDNFEEAKKLIEARPISRDGIVANYIINEWEEAVYLTFDMPILNLAYYEELIIIKEGKNE